jgi:hypothetical protein
MTTGRVEKVALAFTERFWPREPSGYLRVFDAGGARVSEWLDLTDTVGSPLITGLFAGRWAEELWDGRTDEEIVSAAVDVLLTLSSARPTEVPRAATIRPTS